MEYSGYVWGGWILFSAERKGGGGSLVSWRSSKPLPPYPNYFFLKKFSQKNYKNLRKLGALFTEDAIMQHWYDSAINLEPVQITAATLHRMVPNCSQPSLWADALGTRLTTAEIESNHEVALFLAHAGHESASFHQLEESLNYSTESLHKLFGAHRIARLDIEALGRKKNQQANQVGLGNVLYGGEWGKANLGNVYPGDGYNFRGRGIFQLTGRFNYAQCADQTGLDIVNAPDLLSSDPVAAVVSALWYWQTFVTGNDVRSTTKQVNGGYHGLPDRIQRYKRALSVLESV